MHQYSTGRLPASFTGIFRLLRETEDMNNRNSFYNFSVSVPIKKSIAQFPRVIFPPIWNGLSSLHQSTESQKCFKKDLKNEMLSKYSEFDVCDNLACIECSTVLY